ncbi:MAG TPA: hypothetical protein VEQ87_22245 [Burkholderiales bacterium]|nr:hypothetical protein [Burkholderiales bacterium]
MRGLVLVCAAFVAPCFAAGAPASVAGGKGGALLSSAPASSTTSSRHGGGGGGGRQRVDPRQVPPLDPDRSVTEQDCTKPVDVTRGNLKCK